jgi:hypothetical protein
VEGDLRREVQLNIKRLIETGSYCGCYRRNLLVNGENALPALAGPKKMWLVAAGPRREEEIRLLCFSASQIGYLPPSGCLAGMEFTDLCFDQK